ncbi:Bifunctional acetohydroxyacid reductoisomerase [Mortierella sp. 14UC]|nr:Bifunctional acetohydroxyacid reductoisomerase [Mortierella sp. 14UC]
MNQPSAVALGLGWSLRKPIFEELYESVANGSETRRSLTKNSTPNYRAELEVELAEIADHEMWRVGKTVRKLRPENN